MTYVLAAALVWLFFESVAARDYVASAILALAVGILAATITVKALT